MDRIETEKNYSQKVEVLNELKAKIDSSVSDPINVSLASDGVVQGAGSSSPAVRTYPINTGLWSVVKPTASNFLNICIGSCVASNQGASVVVPLNIVFYNLPSSKVDSLIDEIENSLPILFPQGSTIRFTYSTVDNSMNLRFYVVSVQ